MTTGQEQDFDYGIRNTASEQVTDAVHIVGQNIDGTHEKIPTENIEKTSNKTSSIETYSEDLYPNEKAVHDALDTKLNVSDLPSNLTFYATTATADVVGYLKLVDNVEDPDYNDVAVDVSTGAITTTDQLISSLISDAGLLSGNPGIVNITTVGNIKRVSGTGTADFFVRAYHRDNLGVETLVGTSNNTEAVSNSTYEQFSATLMWNDGEFTSTDRVVLKFYANRISGGGNPTYNFQFGGDTPVRTIVPVPFFVVAGEYELKSNKENTTLDTSTTKYPTNRLVKEYTDAKVEDAIVDGVTAVAPSQNAVFDALALKANDNNVVHLTGTETITGAKTFNNSLSPNTDVIFADNNPIANQGTNGRTIVAKSSGSSGLKNFVGLNGITETFSVNAAGETIAFSFIKRGDTNSNILLAGGGVAALSSKQDTLPNPTTGERSSSTNPTYALQDGAVLYHSEKWFIPSGTVSTSGTTVTSVGTQFTSGMVGAKITINGESRIITAFTSSNVVTVGVAFSQNYSGVVAGSWGVYNKAIQIFNFTIFFYYYNSNIAVSITNDSGINASNFQLPASGFYSTETVLANNYTFKWSQDSNKFGTKDLGLRRNAAGIYEIYDGINANGLEANRRDLLVRNLTATTIVKSGGTNSQILLADGSVLDRTSINGALVAINEGNGVGYVIVGRNPANYGNVGLGADDFSTSSGASTTKGATGAYSFCESDDNTASGYASHAEGQVNTASGYASHAEGQGNIASGVASHAEGGSNTVTSNFAHVEGNNCKASGNSSHAEGGQTIASGVASHAEGSTTIASASHSHAEGLGNFARSQAEHSGGLYGTDYTPTLSYTDRLVNYGNGTGIGARSDAFTIFKNGTVRFFRATLASILNPLSGMLIFDSENSNRPKIHNGTAWKGLAYDNEINIGIAPASATDTGTTGEIRYTADYIYVCVATNTWKRTALTTW